MNAKGMPPRPPSSSAPALLAGTGDFVPAILAAAAHDGFLAGDVARTRALTTAVLDATDQPAARGEALVTMGRLELSAGSVPRAAELLTSAVDLIQSAELTSALAELAPVRFRLNDVVGVADCASTMTGVADRDDPRPRMLADFTHARAASVAGYPGESQRLMADAVARIGQPPLRDEPQSLVSRARGGGPEPTYAASSRWGSICLPWPATVVRWA